jgi:hypothetical protein
VSEAIDVSAYIGRHVIIKRSGARAQIICITEANGWLVKLVDVSDLDISTDITYPNLQVEFEGKELRLAPKGNT